MKMCCRLRMQHNINNMTVVLLQTLTICSHSGQRYHTLVELEYRCNGYQILTSNCKQTGRTIICIAE